MLIRLTGGLGNQMFIYAFAKSLSLKGYPILLDATAYNDGLRPKTMRQDCNADSVSTATICGGGGGQTYVV